MQDAFRRTHPFLCSMLLRVKGGHGAGMSIGMFIKLFCSLFRFLGRNITKLPNRPGQLAVDRIAISRFSIPRTWLGLPSPGLSVCFLGQGRVKVKPPPVHVICRYYISPWPRPGFLTCFLPQPPVVHLSPAWEFPRPDGRSVGLQV